MCRNRAIGLGLGLLVGSGCGVLTDREEPEGLPDARDLLNPAMGPEPTTETGIARLSRFESEAEFEVYVKGQMLAQADRFDGFAFEVFDNDAVFDVFQDDFGTGIGFGGDIAPEPGGGEGARDGEAPAQEDLGYSGTTIQERGVDEADVVKTDGRYLYILPVAWDIWDDDGTELQIVQAVPADELALVSTFPLKGWGGELYLVGDRAVVLTGRFGTDARAASGLDFAAIGSFLDALGQLADADDEEPDADAVAIVLDSLDSLLSFLRPQTIVTIIDIADPADPKLVAETTLDGFISSSRMIGGELRLVLTEDVGIYMEFLPQDAREVEVLVDLLDPNILLPTFETTYASGEVRDGKIVEWDDFIRPADPDGFGMTTVITMDTLARGNFEALAVLADPGLIYASTEALYLTDAAWAWSFDRRRVDTDIYKFTFQEGSVALVAAGTVPGRILNQYSMGEYQGYLRVATTSDALFDWETGDAVASSNAVYVLGVEEGDDSDGGRLSIVGRIENLGVTEQVKSARFLGPRGYVVTFRQTDPFYTLDLSDPTDPRVVGELGGIPGFSTFITPMGDDHLLTVGNYADPETGWINGVQMSIFDVSDFADPVQVYSERIGTEFTGSEAVWNPKAFTYFASADLVVLPITHWSWFSIDGWLEDGWFETDGWVGTDGGFATDGFAPPAEDQPVPSPRQTPTPDLDELDWFQGVFIYRATAEEGFNYLGRVSTGAQDSAEGFFDEYWPYFTRGLFIGDTVYAVTDRVVVSAPVASPDETASRVELPGRELDSSDEAVVTEPDA